MEANVQKHEDLLSRWRLEPHHQGQHFIEDGIIDVERWVRAERKVMLLLKEAYGDYNDLRWLIRDEWKGPKYKMWWTASYWIYALQKMSGRETPPFPKDQSQFGQCAEYLLSAAVVNIKKSGGKTASSAEDLNQYATNDLPLLREQITLINPGIIICGYTFEQLHNIWPQRFEPVGGTEFVYRAGRYTAVNWWHPSNQYPDELCYYALCSVVQDAGVL